MMLYAFPGQRVRFLGVFVELKCFAEIHINLVVGSL